MSVKKKKNVEYDWAPFPGSQQNFLQCPYWEVLFHGTRGPGKTDAMLMDFAQHTGQGFGENWRGILFRNTYKQLKDIIAKSKKWFNQVFPEASWNGSEHVWTWPDGEQLYLSYMDRPEDYWNYHGHEYPWIGWEELTNWASPECYDMMKACSRSTHPGMPRKYRATCNPYGPGHNWIKLRFIDQAETKQPIVDENGNKRCHIFGHWSENKFLVENDEEYIQRLKSISDENKRKAWLEGSWDIVAGGMFDDFWETDIHVIPQPQLNGDWEIILSLDWGSSAPFSVGWNAKAGRGCSIEYTQGGDPIEKEIPEDSIIRMNEWYGWNGEPDTGMKLNAREVANGIKEREKRDKYPQWTKPGVADYSLWNVDNENSIYSDFSAEGVEFDKKASKEVKGSNSRKPGWEKMRGMLNNATDEPWENPILLVTEECKQFRRTVPTLPRDERDMDDVDTDAEDHIADEARYMCLFDPTPKGGGTADVGGF